MREKAIKACKRYFKLMNYEHLGSVDGFEVFEDEDGYYVFVNTTYSTSGFAESDVETLQSEAEAAMVHWFSDHEEICDIPIRVDEVQLHILNEGRALVRHKVNAIKEDWR